VQLVPHLIRHRYGFEAVPVRVTYRGDGHPGIEIAYQHVGADGLLDRLGELAIERNGHDHPA
jgi:hypothetical protein